MPTALFPDGTAYPFTAATPPGTLAGLKQQVAAVSGYPAEDLVFPAGYTDENVYHPNVEAIWLQGETISVVRDVERGEQLRRLYEFDAFDANEPWNSDWMNRNVNGFFHACVLGTEDTHGYTNDDGADDMDGERHDHRVPKDADFLRTRATLAPEHREVVETMLQDFELIHALALHVCDKQLAAIVRELPLVYRQDRTFVMDCLQMQPAVLEWADEALRDDADVVRSAVCRSLDNEFRFVENDDLPFVAFDVIGSPHVLQYASDRLRNDKPFLESIISVGTFQPNVLVFAGDHVRADRAFAKHLIVTHGVNPLPFVADALRDDDTLVQALLNAVWMLPMFDIYNKDMYTTILDARVGQWKYGVRFGTILDGLSPRLCRDRELAVRALRAFPTDWSHLSQGLKHDEALHRMVVQEVSTHWDFHEEGAADALPDDLVVQMVSQPQGGGTLFPCLNETQRDTHDIVLAAVKLIGMNLEYASERLRDDETIVRMAIAPHCSSQTYQRDEHVLQFASERLRQDRDFVRSTLRLSRRALYYRTNAWTRCYEAMEQRGPVAFRYHPRWQYPNYVYEEEEEDAY